MTVKKLAATFSLDSTDFEKKIKHCMENDVAVALMPPEMGDEKQIENLAYMLLNFVPSPKKTCTACNGTFYFFTRQLEPALKNQEKGVCPICGQLLPTMVLLGVPPNKIRDWILSAGNINPYEIMRDAIDEAIRNGTVTVRKEEKKDGDKSH